MFDEEHEEIYNLLQKAMYKLSKLNIEQNRINSADPEIHETRDHESKSILFLRGFGCRCVIDLDDELRKTIHRLMDDYRNQFVDQFSTWYRRLEMSIELERINIEHRMPESFKAYSKTGLFCSSDILNFTLYDQKLRDELEELVELHGWKKVVMIICEEGKKMEILD